MENSIFFESAGDERGTPQDFFDKLHAEFNFDLDAAASSLNHKCELWFGEGGIANDALDTDWAGATVWLNPPYSVCGAFIAKAAEESRKGATVVILAPVRCDTRWWHSYVWDERKHMPRPGVECRLLPGRLSFELNVPPAVRQEICLQLAGLEGDPYKNVVKHLVGQTGLPKMAVERIHQDWPDEDLLDSAPFPSCVIVFKLFEIKE